MVPDAAGAGNGAVTEGATNERADVKESCGSDQIVTGIKGYHKSDSGGFFSGIAIRCSALTGTNSRSR